MAAASSRLAFRVHPDRMSMIEQAAALVHEAVSDFARDAAGQRAARIIGEHEATTTVPAEFFEEMRAALDAPPSPNPSLIRAAQRGHRHYPGLTRRGAQPARQAILSVRNSFKVRFLTALE